MRMRRSRAAVSGAGVKLALTVIILGACAGRQGTAPLVDDTCVPSCQIEVENVSALTLELIANSPDAGQVIGEVGPRQLRTFTVPALPRTLYGTYRQGGQRMVRVCRYRGIHVQNHRFECESR